MNGNKKSFDFTVLIFTFDYCARIKSTLQLNKYKRFLFNFITIKMDHQLPLTVRVEVAWAPMEY